MRAFILILFAVFICTAQAQQQGYVYVRSGAVICAPRQLPSVGIRQDTGSAVLGLHGAADGVCAACGWYRVVPSVQRAAEGQVVTGRTYALGKDIAQEVLTFGAKKAAPTLEARVKAIFAAPELAAMEDDARIAAVIGAVAQAVTGAVDNAVTVTIPAKTTEKTGKDAGGLERK